MNNELLNCLKKLAEGSDQSWFDDLPQRKQDEVLHANRQRDKKLNANLPQDTFEMLHGNKKFYTTTQLSDTYFANWLKSNVPGKVFLDYACGNGKHVLQAAELGAELAIGIDISDVSIKNAWDFAKEKGLEKKCFFLHGDCENTRLPDDSIDVVLCSGVLHHMDLSYAFPEIRRILKPGGMALAIEALDYNPAIKLYRKLTPGMRTTWEKGHILSLKDVRFAKRFFNVSEIKYWHLFSIVSAFFRNSYFFKPCLGLFNFLDRLILKIPGLQLMGWQFTFVFQKKPTA